MRIKQGSLSYSLANQNSLLIQVSCVKSSQGFDWNQGEFDQTCRQRAFAQSFSTSLLTYILNRTELFLPSYAEYESQDLERKQDPVEDIVLTDEEVAAMFPQ